MILQRIENFFTAHLKLDRRPLMDGTSLGHWQVSFMTLNVTRAFIGMH